MIAVTKTIYTLVLLGYSSILPISDYTSDEACRQAALSAMRIPAAGSISSSVGAICVPVEVEVMEDWNQ